MKIISFSFIIHHTSSAPSVPSHEHLSIALSINYLSHFHIVVIIWFAEKAMSLSTKEIIHKQNNKKKYSSGYLL